MAALPKFCIALLFAFSLVGLSVPAHAPDSSPGPAPAFGTESPLPLAPEPNVRAPVNPPSALSPRAPSPGNLPPDSSPTPKLQAPTPKTPVSHKINPEKSSGSGKEEKSSSDGMSRDKKAGIVVAVIVAAGLGVVAGLVYKKRRDNIRRGQYGYAVRREIL